MTRRAGADVLYDFAPMANDYERWYDTPEGRSNDRVQQRDVRALLPPAERGERLLDAGCGTGHWSRFFDALGYTVHGVDRSEAMIRTALTASPACRFGVADARALPFDDATFEVAAAMAVLEFIPDPAVAVREMRRCLKPGGRLLIGTLNRLAPLNRQRLAAGEQPYASAHLFSPTGLRDLLEPFGTPHLVASRPANGCGELEPRVVTIPPADACHLDGPFLIARVQLP